MANMNDEIKATEKEWAGKNQFKELAVALRNAGADVEAQLADELGDKFPSADLIAYHAMQRQPASCWNNFMFSKIRGFCAGRNKDLRAREVFIKVHNLEETERVGD